MVLVLCATKYTPCKYNKIKLRFIHKFQGKGRLFPDMYFEGPTDFRTHLAAITITIGQIRYPKLKSKQSLYLGGLRANMHRHRGKYCTNVDASVKMN